MQPPDYNPQGDCAEPYQGILCASCEPGFTISADYKCSRCPPLGTNTIRLIGIFITVIILVVMLIRSTLQGAAEKKNVTSIYTKILMNHF